jgi:ethanolamine utilization protein EutN
MQLARVIGHAVATVKHASMQGWRLLVVQPLGVDDKPDGEPLLAVDNLGSALDGRVIISNDGAGARQLVGVKTSPVRWFVMGQKDECHAHR